MDIDAAKSFALNYLTNIVGPEFQYHNLSHTLDVFQSVSILAISEKINKNDLLLLQTAALYHDLGIHKNYDAHEEESIGIVKKVLPDFDFTIIEINTICKLISETSIPKLPKSKVGELLCDADLDYLGRDDYLEISKRLKLEWETLEIAKYSDKDWYLFQLDFLRNHSYYSQSARLTRDIGKTLNIKKLLDLLKKI